jgi:hypothetical protein
MDDAARAIACSDVLGAQCWPGRPSLLSRQGTPAQLAHWKKITNLLSKHRPGHRAGHPLEVLALLDRDLPARLHLPRGHGRPATPARLVTACWLHSVTVTCRRPIAQGSPARSRSRHLHPADAPLARSLPVGRVCHIVAGLPRGEIGLFPTRGKAAARSFSSPTAQRDRYPYGELRPNRDPERGTYCSRVHFMAALTSMRPGHRPFRAPLPDCRWPQFSPAGRIFRGPAPARQPRTSRQSSQK